MVNADADSFASADHGGGVFTVGGGGAVVFVAVLVAGALGGGSGCAGKREPAAVSAAVSAAVPAAASAAVSAAAGAAAPCSAELAAARQKLIAARSAVVGAAVTDLMERPDAAAPLADQALFGDLLRILTAPGDCVMPGGRFVHIETEAHYRGYVAVSALVPWPEPERAYRSGPLWRVISRFANVYPQPDLTRSNPLVVLPLGTALRPEQKLSERWLEVALPDGRHGFAQRGDLSYEPQPPATTAACIVEHALQHEGSPYLWGGRSTYGIDCSGLVANAYGACGVIVPRDAHLQFDWEAMEPIGQPTADSLRALQPADLLFFVSGDAPPDGPGSARSAKPKITHVGIYLGDGRFVHATTSERPLVQKSELLGGDGGWLKRWAGTRRYRRLAQ